MSRVYRTREGGITAVDTRTQLTTLGSETAPGPLLVPQGVTKLVGILVAQCENYTAATSYSALVRLEGPGLKEGPETFAVGSGGTAVATGGNNVNQSKLIPFEAEVVPAQEILIYGEMCGTDIGAVEMGVTLIFE